MKKVSLKEDRGATLSIWGLSCHWMVMRAHSSSPRSKRNSQAPPATAPTTSSGPIVCCPIRSTSRTKPTPTAPAQRVVISDRLTNRLDWSTLSDGDCFSDQFIAVPPGTKHFETVNGYQ